MHVDDFLSPGSEVFIKDVFQQLSKIYSFGKVIQNKFTYTGLHVDQDEDKDIYVDQEEFIENIPVFEYDKQYNTLCYQIYNIFYFHSNFAIFSYCYIYI